VRAERSSSSVGGGTLTSSWTRRLVSSARGLDLEIGSVLAEVGIDPHALEDPHGRVPYDRHVETVTRVAKRLDDPGIGIQMGADSGPADFGVVSLLAQTCSTLRGALQTIHRFNALANQASLMDYWVEAGRLFIQDGHGRDGRPMPPAIAEATLAFYATMIRLTCGVERPCVEVWLAHERHRGWTPARLAHFDATLRFGRPFNALVLPAGMLDASFLSAQPARSVDLLTLAQRLEGNITAMDDATTRLLARVRQDLIRGEARSLARTARALGTSGRTLQRELEAAGLTFRDVVDTARRELAPTFLADRDLKVETVARHLGYTDARSFRRACLRWFGKAPGRDRDLRCR
jgi:AraC-like DNA-binding protein